MLLTTLADVQKSYFKEGFRPPKKELLDAINRGQLDGVQIDNTHYIDIDALERSVLSPPKATSGGGSSNVNPILASVSVP